MQKYSLNTADLIECEESLFQMKPRNNRNGNNQFSADIKYKLNDRQLRSVKLRLIQKRKNIYKVLSGERQ